MGARTNPRQRLLDRGRGFKPRGKNSFTDGKRGHASRQKHVNFGRQHLPAAGPQTQKRREQAVRPRWKRREGPTLERGSNSTFFFWGELRGYLPVSYLCSACALCVLCFPNLFFFSGDDFSAKLKDMRGDADQVAEVRNRRASIFSPITLLKMAKTSNTRFGRSAHALG